MKENVNSKKSIRIRSQKDERRKFLEENKERQGCAKSSLRNVPTSPRKMRLVADMIRNKDVATALNILKFDNHIASGYLEKLLLTSIASWQEKNEGVNVEDAHLVLKGVYVDSGKILKRLRPAPQGRSHRIRKRSNHVTMLVEGRMLVDNDTLINENTDNGTKE